MSIPPLCAIARAFARLVKPVPGAFRAAQSATPASRDPPASKQIFLRLHAGSTWKSLPEEEKQVWVNLAARATAEHKIKYPGYKYQPQHRPKKRKAPKPANDNDRESEQRC